MEKFSDKDQDIYTAGGHAGEDAPAASAGDDSKEATPGRHAFFRLCAVAGFLCAIAGWLLFYYEPGAAVATGSAGVLASVVGLWSGRGCIRSLSVTGLVASGVLVLVYAAFFWGLAWGVSHL